MLKNLIKWEFAHGYKAKFVAAKVGLDESQYSKLKAGKLKPSLEVAQKFQSEFNIDNVYDLLKNFDEVQ